ncbi:MAG TPA: PAS domain S-box protein, partial [Bacteroidetes bacterium]|nr:PAS domain S-box protein [Bacteroidota bacterium]
MRTSLRYTLWGFIFGLTFPVCGILLKLLVDGEGLSWANMIEIQSNNSLMWVIDSAPFFLGLFAWMAGIRQEWGENMNRETESDVEHLFRISRDLLCVCQGDGNILRLNLTFAALLGYTQEELREKKITDLVCEADKGFTLAALEAVNTAEGDTHFENRLTCKDGRLLRVEWSLSPPMNGKFLAIGRDITLKRKADAQLKMYAESLERSVTELDQFAYVVSHDLKAPLRGIYSLADFIEEDLAEGDHALVIKNLDLLKKRAARMQNLIMGVLDYSRAGKELGDRITIDLGEFLKEIVDALVIPIDFKVEFSPELPTIFFNPTKLQQVFQNLLSNAIQYHDRNPGKVVITCKSRGNFWEFSVSDDGPGIPQQFHTQVFTMFRTLKS